MSTFVRPPPPKWQPKKNERQNNQRIFQIQKGGKVDSYSYNELKELREQKIAKKLENKGKLYRIEQSETILRKIREPQTKLWYYDKRNYEKPAPEKEPEKEPEKKPEPEPEKKPDPEPEPEPKPVEKEEPKKEEEKPKFEEKPKEELAPKEPTPAPSPEPEQKIQEQIQPVQEVRKSAQKSLRVAPAIVAAPFIADMPSFSPAHTLESINKSMKYYRFH